MRKGTFCGWVITTIILTGLASGQSYTMTGMGTLGGAESDALAINDHGAAVGFSYLSNGEAHAFVWTSSSGIHDLGNLDGSSAESVATGINNSQQISGYSYLSGGAMVHAFLWTKSGGMQDLGTLGGAHSEGMSINSSGEIVGNSLLSDGVTEHAFLWSAMGGMQDLGTLGGHISSAQAINDAGQVVGFSYLADNVTYHAFLWTQVGGMVDLGTLGGQDSAAYAVNALGEIAGSASTPTGAGVASLWTKTHGMQSLGAGSQSGAQGLNQSGQVVGSNTKFPFLWTPTSHLQNLNDLIPPNSGWVLLTAGGISRSGQIAATGQIGSTTEAVLLTPAN